MSHSFVKPGAIKAADMLHAPCSAGTYIVIYYFSENLDGQANI